MSMTIFIMMICFHFSSRLKAPDKHGITALLAAIWEGHYDCVKLLIEAGANTGLKTPDGKSYAEVAEKQEIKSLLVGQ